MGIPTDIIVATPEQISLAFPAWLPVAPEPITREVKNPFTGEGRTVTDWLPAVDPPADIGAADAIGDYGQLPHVRMKGILHGELAELAEVLTATDTGETIELLSKPALLDPLGSNETGIHRFPEYFTSALATLRDNDRIEVSKRWSRARGIHWTAEDCSFVLQELVRLAGIATETQAGLYLWWSL